uniref:glucuronosyltransferase n=1 Tax=Parascaris univalens TaxID=6257 RepID=A0A915A971_PARUN
PHLCASHLRTSSLGISLRFISCLSVALQMTVWRYLLKRDQLRAIVDISGEFCRLMVNDKDLIVWLRNEKFDAALASIYDMCASGLFHVANIKPVMGFIPTPASSIIFSMFGISTPSSYTQDSLFPTGSGDVMNYWQRAKNLAIQYLLEYVTTPYVERMQHQVFTDKFGPSFPSLRSLLINFSYVFINSNELFELPRPLSHKMIYVGGIALPKQKRLPEVYLKLFSEYPSAVLFSFGSLARTTLMPIEMKSAFIDAFAKFPHILFIWKVDRGTANDSFYTKAPNVFTVEWTPQNDLLRSGHIDAFITHAGLNSLSEAIFAGVPVISIPLFGE